MNSKPVSRKLAALMHADVKSYSRLMSENEEETVRTLTSYKDLLFNYVNAHRGRIVDMAGDGFLVEFGSVVDALLCAVDFQKETQSRNQALPENRRLEFRIGINIGDVIQHGEQIFGDGVNIAARLESIADPGGICVSGEAYDQLKRKLEMNFEFLGEKNVKNISEPIRAYRVVVDPQRIQLSTDRRPSVRSKDKRSLIPLIVLGSLIIVVIVFLLIHRGGKQRLGKKEVVTSIPTVTETVKDSGSQETYRPIPFSIALLQPEDVDDTITNYLICGLTEVITDKFGRIPSLTIISKRPTLQPSIEKIDSEIWARRNNVKFILESNMTVERTHVTDILKVINLIDNSVIRSEIISVDRNVLWKLPDLFVQKTLEALSDDGVTIKDLQPRLQQPPTSSARSYELFLEALGYSNLGSKQGNETAIRLFQEALELDPEFAPALSELASAYFVKVRNRWTDNARESMEQAVQLSKRALRIDDSLSTPYSVLALVSLQKRFYQEALLNAEKAASRSPGNAETNSVMGLVLTFSGHSLEAIPYLDKAIRLNPGASVRSFTVLGHAYLSAQKYEDAISAYKKALDMEPHSPAILCFLAGAYVMAGHRIEAEATTSELAKVSPNFSVQNLMKRLPFKDPAETSRILDALQKVGLR